MWHPLVQFGVRPALNIRFLTLWETKEVDYLGRNLGLGYSEVKREVSLARSLVSGDEASVVDGSTKPSNDAINLGRQWTAAQPRFKKWKKRKRRDPVSDPSPYPALPLYLSTRVDAISLRIISE